MRAPYLRPARPEGAPPAPCPPGHQAEAAGLWHGRNMEVVYDPRRHDVVFLLGGVSGKVRDGLASTGWQRQLTDGANEMWTRDRIALARQRLSHAPARSGPVKIA